MITKSNYAGGHAITQLCDILPKMSHNSENLGPYIPTLWYARRWHTPVIANCYPKLDATLEVNFLRWVTMSKGRAAFPSAAHKLRIEERRSFSYNKTR